MQSAQTLGTQDFYDVFLAGDRLISQMHRLLHAAAKSLELSEIECRVLWICHRDQAVGADQGGIAKELGRSTSWLCEVLDSLRCRNLIESERRPTDRRRQYWRLTGHGATQIVPVIKQLESALLSSQAEQEAAVQFRIAAEELSSALSRPRTALRKTAREMAA